MDITFVDVEKDYTNIFPKLPSVNHVELIKDVKDIKFKEGYFNILLANEFFDALPTDLFILNDEGILQETLIKTNGNSLFFAQEPYKRGRISKLLEKYLFINVKKGKTIEISQEVFNVINCLKKSFILFPKSLGIIADYGYYAPSEFSLRAISDHNFIELFDKIDGTDYSVNVDFKLIHELLRDEKILTSEIKTQAKFLIENSLLSGVIENEKRRSIHRLLSPYEMGTIYKVLLVSS